MSHVILVFNYQTISLQFPVKFVSPIFQNFSMSTSILFFSREFVGDRLGFAGISREPCVTLPAAHSLCFRVCFTACTPCESSTQRPYGTFRHLKFLPYLIRLVLINKLITVLTATTHHLTVPFVDAKEPFNLGWSRLLPNVTWYSSYSQSYS